MRITESYLWQFLFSALFVSFVISGMIILGEEGISKLEALTTFDVVILSLATLRLTRLVVYDNVSACFREQFFDITTSRAKRSLEKPEGGPRRTLAELVSCPWCVGMWASATVLFFFLLSPLALFPIYFFAIAGVATGLQILINMMGWKAEVLKRDVE